jgi:hypothetical protein
MGSWAHASDVNQHIRFCLLNVGCLYRYSAISGASIEKILDLSPFGRRGR